MTDLINDAEVQQDIFALILNDHNLVRSVFQQWTTQSDFRTKQRLVSQAVELLNLHAVGEELILYPVIRGLLPDGHALADHSLLEHQQAKDEIAKLLQQSGDEQIINVEFPKLIAAVTHHVEEEESELIPKLRPLVNREQSAILARAFLAAKGQGQRLGVQTGPLKPVLDLRGENVDGIFNKVSQWASSFGRA